jgi:tetratricopeptide (TPR) repeat protein
VKNRLLPWVGWDTGEVSLLLLPHDGFVRGRSFRPRVTKDPFAEMARSWWDRFATAGDWEKAAAIGKLAADRRPNEPWGWENWAWALYKQGKPLAAYKTLAPLLKKLALPGPPSGRAAYSLACFCGTLNKVREGARWLRLAYTLAGDKDEFRVHALLEPDLREIWPGVSELSTDACSVLE